MKTLSCGRGSPEFYSLRQAAWILGVTESEVCRLVRLGTLPAVRRRSRLVIQATTLSRLLPARRGEGVAR